MFTGLVEETAPLIAVTPTQGGARLTLEASVVLGGTGGDAPTQAGDSVAVNGCCLTVTERQGGRLSFDLLAETLDKTNLGDQRPGARLNLERALAPHTRMGGHFVQGHVDCAARVLSLEPHGQDHRLEVEIPRAFARYVAYKGSIAINGISLTAAEVLDDLADSAAEDAQGGVARVHTDASSGGAGTPPRGHSAAHGASRVVVWLIPHTMAVTNLHRLRAGDRVNLEFDMLAKYLERLVDPRLR